MSQKINLYLLLVLSVIFVSCQSSKQGNDIAENETKADTIHSVELLYGLPVDSFTIEQYTVGKNEILSKILLRAGVQYSAINEASEKAEPIFSVRNIRQGNDYTLFFSNDTTRTLQHFVYTINSQSYLTLSFLDSISATISRRTVRTEEREATSEITSSLWNAITDKGLNPQIALELSDIYAWTIDFFGIEKGDNFKVIYTENFVDSTSIGIGEIKAAVFSSHGKAHYAFVYEQDSIRSYFDLEGNSLRKAFLKAPLKYSRISSKFSNGRFHPVLKKVRAHHGIDYAAPKGTPVFSIGDGRVIAKGYQANGGGNYIKIKHNSIYTTVYMHLNSFAKGIAIGTIVKQGEQIGTVGSTGLATGPHLDFRVYMNDQAIDPLKMEAPSVEPVSNDNIQEFINYSEELRKRLEGIKN